MHFDFVWTIVCYKAIYGIIEPKKHTVDGGNRQNQWPLGH
jgi:hypothetical protein